MSGDSELAKPKAWIGVDQSYSGFGLVIISENYMLPLLWNFTKNKGGDSERLSIISNMLTYHFWEHKHKYECSVTMEGYAHGAKFNREKLGELGGIVKLATHEVFKKEPLIVSPTALKKYVTGKGTASKAQMIAGVEEKWDIVFDDDNLADAYALAQYGREAS